jgi:hypothetical protein
VKTGPLLHRGWRSPARAVTALLALAAAACSTPSAGSSSSPTAPPSSAATTQAAPQQDLTEGALDIRTPAGACAAEVLGATAVLYNGDESGNGVVSLEGLLGADTPTVLLAERDLALAENTAAGESVDEAAQAAAAAIPAICAESGNPVLTHYQLLELITITPQPQVGRVLRVGYYRSPTAAATAGSGGSLGTGVGPTSAQSSPNPAASAPFTPMDELTPTASRPPGSPCQSIAALAKQALVWIPAAGDQWTAGDELNVKEDALALSKISRTGLPPPYLAAVYTFLNDSTKFSFTPPPSSASFRVALTTLEQGCS